MAVAVPVAVSVAVVVVALALAHALALAAPVAVAPVVTVVVAATAAAATSFLNTINALASQERSRCFSPGAAQPQRSRRPQANTPTRTRPTNA